jgi:integrase
LRVFRSLPNVFGLSIGAGGRNRTDTWFPKPDFESGKYGPFNDLRFPAITKQSRNNRLKSSPCILLRIWRDFRLLLLICLHCVYMSLHQMSTSYAEITERVVREAEPPEKGQRFIRDTKLSGFALRITDTGARAFIVEARIKHGRPRRVTIARCDTMSVQDARREARKVLGGFAVGDDPVTERQAEKSRNVSLVEAFEEYLKARNDLKASTLADYREAMNTSFSDWQKKPVAAITETMVARRHAERGKDSPSRANHAMRLLRAVINFAMGRYRDTEGAPVMTENPVKRLSRERSWFRVDRRRTVIKSYQFGPWYKSVAGLRALKSNADVDSIRDYLLFLAFTGLRKEEAAGLTWPNVDFRDRTFTVLDTKNHDPHVLPMSDLLADLLARRKAAALADAEYVFTGRSGRLVDVRHWVLKIAGESGVPFTLHDLRRTFITTAESLDISTYALKRLLNHRAAHSDVTAGYIVHDVERLRRPMQMITDKLLEDANNGALE